MATVKITISPDGTISITSSPQGGGCNDNVTTMLSATRATAQMPSGSKLFDLALMSDGDLDAAVEKAMDTVTEGEKIPVQYQNDLITLKNDIIRDINQTKGNDLTAQEIAQLEQIDGKVELAIQALLQKPDLKLQAGVSLSPCTTAIIKAVVAGFFFALGVFGIHAAAGAEANVAEAIGAGMTPTALTGLEKLMHAYEATASNLGKAKVLFQIIKQAVNITGLKTLAQAVFRNLGWWDYTKMTIILVAQMTAWFATDGIAFIAQIALAIPSAVDFGIAVANTIKTCSATSKATVRV